MLHKIPEEQCLPAEFASFGFSSICLYVQNQSDVCDGGGYLLWTQYALCAAESSGLLRTLVVLASLVFLVLLFVHLSTTADSFFCENIAAIVDIHHISQNIAGITFMAFGNGAPDIFSSIASVISSKTPRADLAISELLGGGIFVTTCVIGVIALTRPFHLMRRPILRDILFYLGALSLLTFVTYNGGQMELWHPLAFLGLYLVYAVTVVCSNLFRQRIRKVESRRRMRKTISRFSGLVPPKRTKVAPIPEEVVRQAEIDKMEGEPEKGPGRFIVTPSVHEGKSRIGKRMVSSVVTLPGGALIVPIQHNPHTDHPPTEQYSASDFLEAGKFFAKEELDELAVDEDVRTEGEEGGQTESNEGTKTGAGHGGTPTTDGSPTPTPMEEDTRQLVRGSKESELGRVLEALTPLDGARFRRGRWHVRLYLIAQIPSLFLLRLTIPSASQPWSKSLATLHAFLAPLVFCFAFQCFRFPLGNSPLILGEIALVCSLLSSLLVLVFTRLDCEPTCYRRCAAYFGFCLSIAWIYATASEVMNVVLMLGTLSGISYQILGLTAIAWSNSIGDLVADITVARQGMSRMAFSAAIGGPLFNLMVGFGATFMIAELQGKYVIMQSNAVASVMFFFLALSLLTTLFLLLLQKFYVRRFHGLTLLVLYFAFLVVAILASQGILPFS